jgi:DNA-binding FadR family transcriptional regulator
MAAVRIPVEELDALEGRLDALGPAPSVEELVAADLDFHRGVVRACGNSVLCSLLDGLSGSTTRTRMWRGLARHDAVGRTLHEHRAILAALRDRDAEAARSWATVHLAGVEQSLRSPRRLP